MCIYAYIFNAPITAQGLQSLERGKVWLPNVIPKNEFDFQIQNINIIVFQK